MSLGSRRLQRRSDQNAKRGDKEYRRSEKLAAETADIAARIDLSNAKTSVVTTSLSPDDIERAVADDLAKLEEKMKEAHLLYGTQILQLESKPVPDKSA